jgi:hypothetical protein
MPDSFTDGGHANFHLHRAYLSVASKAALVGAPAATNTETTLEAPVVASTGIAAGPKANTSRRTK